MSGKSNHAIKKFKDQVARDASINSFESFFIRMNSDGELCVRGVKCISSCSDEEISFDCEQNSISVKGKGLVLGVFSEEETVIRGEVRDISFLLGGN